MTEENRDNEEQPFEEPVGSETGEEPVEQIDEEPDLTPDATARETPELEQTEPQPPEPAETIRPEADLPGSQPRKELGEEIASPPADDDEGWVTVTPPTPPAPEPEASGARVYDTADDWRTPEVSGTVTEPEPQPVPVQREVGASPGVTAERPADFPPPSAEVRPPKPEGNAFGPIGDLLAGLGIRDRQAQQWVAIGALIVLLGCCACTCIIPMLSLLADA